MVIFDKKEVGNRIIQLQKILVLNNLQFANSIRADPSYLSKVKRGHRSLSKTYLEAIENKCKVRRQWLLFGEGDIFQNGQNVPYNIGEGPKRGVEEQETTYKHHPKNQGKLLKLRLPLKKRGKPTPVSNDKATPGMVVLINEEPELILEYIDVPFIGWVDGVVEVVGESMHPTFKNGDRIAIKRLDNRSLLNWGEYYYIVDTNWQGVVKRILEGNNGDHIVLQSDNPDQKKFPPIKRRWKDIEAVFKVTGAITKY